MVMFVVLDLKFRPCQCLSLLYRFFTIFLFFILVFLNVFLSKVLGNALLGLHLFGKVKVKKKRKEKIHCTGRVVVHTADL